MNMQRKATITHLEDLGGDEWAFRWSSNSRELWSEIKDDIMLTPKSERRWDPDQYHGKGAWVVSSRVLDDLRKYFPNLYVWMTKSTDKSNDIHSVPF